MTTMLLTYNAPRFTWCRFYCECWRRQPVLTAVL